MADEEKLRQYLKKVTGELQRTARRLHEIELRDREPIAIVGMSCRFPPDVRSAEDLWGLVAADGDGISPFPAGRGWGTVSLTGPDGGMTPDTAACRGGFVTDADLFDAEFFGIGAQEALAMDPQQRLLLETAWEAVEHAGMDPVTLRGTTTGLYVGVSYCNYAARLQATLPEAVEDHLVAGGAPSTTSGRVAYVMGLRGPAISIDTACSSSLAAIHLASQGLRRGDCRLALAGGVTIMATPNVFTEFSRRGALAADGRCKPFAAAADGMGFGEGVGLLVLERLSTALRDGHPVLALIRGSAVNQDGATNGLTSPSRSAQEAVIRQALADARLTPDQVDAVEGHGAGTALGDSIEAEAVIATYGEARPADHPLRLGSVKSNIGHTQAAAGVAGVIKMVMSIRQGTHARTLHVDRPSAYVDWADGRVALTTEPAPWPGNGRPRRAGVSSFGISGTNAHLILEEATATKPDGSAPALRDADDTIVPWVLSAKTSRALRAMAAQLGGFIVANPGAAAADIGISLARTRAGLKHRAVVMGATHSERLAALAAVAHGEHAPGLVTGEAAAAAKTAVVFTGCEPGAGDASRMLTERFPVFAEAFDDVCAQLDVHLDRPVREFLATASRVSGASAPEDTAGSWPLAVYQHAVVFALQTALYRLLCSFGLTPDLVAGSGIGEITAAHAAGVLSLADASALAAAAARTLDAGDREAARRLRAAAERVSYAKPRILIVSGGEPGQPDEPRSPGYWAAGDFLQARTEDMLRSAPSQGAMTRLELGPGVVTAAHRNENAVGAVLECLAEVYTTGTAVSWETAFTGIGAGQVRLPGYPFQRERYWLDTPITLGRGVNAVVREPAHPLLGGTIDLADSAERWFTGTLTAREPWYIAQYRLRETPALPPAAVVEWALAASRHGADESGDAWTIENLTFDEPITFPGKLPVAIQATAEARGAVRRVRGFSGDPGGTQRDWTRRFTALATNQGPPSPDPADLGRLRSRMAEQDPGSLFARYSEPGIDYGPVFRHIARWWRTDDESLVLIQADAAASDGNPHVLHPVVLETCLLSAMPFVSDTGLWLPSGLDRLVCYRRLPQRLWCHVRYARGDAARGGPLDLELFSDSGEPLVIMTGLTYKAADLAQLARSTATSTEPEIAEPWDADELSRLALEEPETARRALMDILFGKITALVEGPPNDWESVRERFASARFSELGLDSLRVIRLRDQFRTQLLVDVPPQRLLGDATVADIVDLVCRFLAARNLVMTGDEQPDTAGQAEELIL